METKERQQAIEGAMTHLLSLLHMEQGEAAIVMCNTEDGITVAMAGKDNSLYSLYINATLKDGRLQKSHHMLDLFIKSADTKFPTDGARWRIASVWHDARAEVPERHRPVLAAHASGLSSVNMLGPGTRSCPAKWARWAYVDDLLPEPTNH